MQIIALASLLWLYAVALQGLMEIFSPLLGFAYDPSYISLIISLVGIGLGLVFYALSLLKPHIKRYIKLGVPAVICFSLVGAYLVAGIPAFVELFIFLIKVGFGLILCAVPLVGAYGLFKKQRNTVLAAGAGILFFFFFTRILLGELVFSVSQIELLLLFFVLFICFLEMGSTSIFFNSIITKMAPQGDGDETMLSRFSNVFNRYLVYTFIVLILCYAVTIVLFNYNDYVISSTPGEIMGIDLGSIYGIWLLVIIMIASAFMFWYLIPREKTKTSEE
jgi:hypothetical protein